MAKPYYKRYPNVPHAISINIDDNKFKYDIPDSKEGDGKHKGGWQALVRFINHVDQMIERGEIDTRQANSDHLMEDVESEAKQPDSVEPSGQHIQVIREREDLSF